MKAAATANWKPVPPRCRSRRTPPPAPNLGGDYAAADASALPLGIELGLVTDDVPAAVTRAVACGATLLTAPQTKRWGQGVAYVRCPDGSLVELCTAVHA